MSAQERGAEKARAMDEASVKQAGRGFLIITAAKVWFLVTSAVIQLGLPIMLGSAEAFGVFKIITESIGLINMVMITGTLNAVSKLVSEQPEQAGRLVNMAVRMQLMLGVPVAALYALGAPWIAGSFNDMTLVPLLRLSALIIFFYAFYAIFVGYFNGLKEFARQASLDFGFSTLKMLGIVGLVLLGFGVGGAVAGFVGAAGIICTVAGVWLFRRERVRRAAGIGQGGLDKGQTRQAFKRLLNYLVLIMLYTFALNGLMRADFFVLKAIASGVPAHLSGMESLFSLMSNKFAGFYGAVLNVARIPYQGVIAVTFVIFPMISQSTFSEDTNQTRAYVRSTLRYCSMLIAAVAMVLAFNADSIIAALYSADYQAASVALSILSVSIIFFALFYVATTMIIGSGHPLAAVVIMGASLGLSAVLNYVFLTRTHAEAMAGLVPVVPVNPSGDAMSVVAQAQAHAEASANFAAPFLLQATDYMQSAAIATTIAMVLGCLLSVGWLWRAFGAAPPWATLGRLLLAAGVLWGIDMAVPLGVELVTSQGKMVYLALVVAKMASMGVALLATLFLTREFTATDMARLKAVISKKTRKA